jgi:putative hydrolase of the HAD superfamily
MRSEGLRAVTFDCWGTLIREVDPDATYGRRVGSLERVACAHGLETDAAGARAALDVAWRRHWELWHRGVASGSYEMAGWALSELAVASGRATPADDVVVLLAESFAEAQLAAEVLALEGARETLERVSEAGLRRALICDTGFSPGRVVRQLLDRLGLFERLELAIFSDEAGVPKPDRRVFETALDAFGLSGEPSAAVHVGDLRRTDVAGAREAGMSSVRIRHHHDDQSDLADADRVADSHAHLREILGLGG